MFQQLMTAAGKTRDLLEKLSTGERFGKSALSRFTTAQKSVSVCYGALPDW
jgi:hypothetical protein